jgi:hemerythrin
MNPIVWNDGLTLHIPEIDAQHKRLVGIVNQLIEIQDQEASDDEMTHILGALTHYIGEHFETEEQMMIDHGYPALASHREEHQDFVTRTAYYIATYQTSGALLKKDLLYFLKTWLVDHIGKTDAAFGAFLRAGGLR